MNPLETYRAAFRGLSREIWILAGVALVNRMGLMVLPFLALYLTSERGFSAAQAGALLALHGAGSLAGITLAGRWIDRVGFRRVMFVSLVGTGVFLITLGLVHATWAIALVAFLAGAAGDALRPATSVGIAHYSKPHERARAYGLFRLAINLGWTIGPAVGGFLALVDYAYLFWIDGVSCLVAAALLLRALPAPGRPTVQPDAPAAARGPSPWRDRRFVTVTALALLQTLIYLQVASTYTLYLAEQRGQPENVIGLLMAVNTILIILVEMPLIHRLEARSPLRLLSLAGAFIGVGFGVLPWSTSLLAITGGIVLWTIGEMLSAPMITTWTSTRASDANRGRYMAAQASSISVAMIVAPLGGTWIYQHVGPDAVWLTCFGLGVSSVVGFWALDRTRPGSVVADSD